MLTSGARRRTARLDIFWRPNVLGHPRLAVVVPRFGCSAVARNRLRRRVREHVRRVVLPRIPALDLLVRPRPGAYGAPAHELVTDLDRWLTLLRP